MAGPAAAELEALLGRMGFALVWSEGSAYVHEDTKALLAMVRPKVTETMADFLRLRQQEESEGFSDDAALRITWDQLGDRVVRWERFLAANPRFAMRQQAQDRYQLYLDTYLTGMDNSRVFGILSDSLEPQVRISYERFIQRYPDTPAAKIIQGYLSLLAANGQKLTDEVQSYLRANGITSMLAVQPPIR